MYIFMNVYSYIFLCMYTVTLLSLSLVACGEGEYVRMDIGIKLLPAVGVTLLSKTDSLLM